MTTMIHNQTTGERLFRVPFAEPMAEGPFRSPGELEIGVNRSGNPNRVALRFYPSTFEFQAKLPRLAHDLGMPDAVFDFGLAASTQQPVVIYEGTPSVRVRITPGMRDLKAVAEFLASGPRLFDLKEYKLAAIEFEEGDVPRA